MQSGFFYDQRFNHTYHNINNINNDYLKVLHVLILGKRLFLRSILT